MTDQRQNLHDELTVIRCQLGERQALDELVERWHPRLWHFTHRMVEREDQCDEAVQETWVRVLRGLPALREPSRFAPWLFGIARRVLIDRLRSKYAQPLEDSSPAEAEAAAEPPVFDAEDVERLRHHLPRLPIIEREALTLSAIEGFATEEIAGITGVPIGTVKSRLHRARRLLREMLEIKGSLP